MTYLAIMLVIVKCPAHHFQGIAKATQIDETEIEGKKESGDNKPDNNQRNLCTGKRRGIEDERRQYIGERLHQLIDFCVYGLCGGRKRENGKKRKQKCKSSEHSESFYE